MPSTFFIINIFYFVLVIKTSKRFAFFIKFNFLLFTVLKSTKQNIFFWALLIVVAKSFLKFFIIFFIKYKSYIINLFFKLLIAVF